MKRKFTEADDQKFAGAMQFLEMVWGVKTDYQLDTETGRADVRLWMPGTDAVLVIVNVDVRHLLVVERDLLRFPEPPPRA